MYKAVPVLVVVVRVTVTVWDMLDITENKCKITGKLGSKQYTTHRRCVGDEGWRSSFLSPPKSSPSQRQNNLRKVDLVEVLHIFKAKPIDNRHYHNIYNDVIAPNIDRVGDHLQKWMVRSTCWRSAGHDATLVCRGRRVPRIHKRKWLACTLRLSECHLMHIFALCHCVLTVTLYIRNQHYNTNTKKHTA